MKRFYKRVELNASLKATGIQTNDGVLFQVVIANEALA